jgi:hypothetical protein
MYGHAMAIPGRGKSRVVALRSAAATQSHEAVEPAVPIEVAASPLYGVAMLKIAMELKKADARPLDELIGGVLSRMRLDEGEFRRFLDANGGLLRTIAQKKKY